MYLPRAIMVDRDEQHLAREHFAHTIPLTKIVTVDHYYQCTTTRISSLLGLKMGEL